MKAFFLTFLILFNLSVFGQTKKTRIDLKQIAKIYLNKMYKDQRFDNCYTSWDKAILNDFLGIYKNKRNLNLDKSNIIDQIKIDYKKHYLTNTEFKIIKFDFEQSEKKGDTTLVYFKYTYSEKENGKINLKTSFIYLVKSKTYIDYKVIDFRVPEILGDSSIWMK